MLAPEINDYKAPPSIFQSQKVEKDHCLKKIRLFNFVHSVTVILPDISSVPETFGFDLSNCDYYRVNSLNLDELVKPDFLYNFINCGKLHLLSVNTRIDCDDCFAVTSCGKLILHLNKLTFQTLGLEGKLSYFHKRSKDKYIVSIDLKTLKPEKGYHERVKTCLKKLKADVILIWESPKKEICPSSIAKYFFDLGFKIKQCKIKQDSETVFNAKVPIIESFDAFDKHESAKFVEWLGMLTINGSMEEKSMFVSTYETPQPSMRLHHVKTLRWRGFFSISAVTDLLEEVEIKYGQKTMWKAIYFQGFSDSPVAWGLGEHHFWTNGDNGAVILLNKGEFHLCSQKCSNKYYK
ncbi:ribonuclease P protein subunit p40-like isoform X2 [Harmonia axyridis]|uniref:ribonuclease P protein subunit p40-like isoform X2 n=1 Tax=Harmonia axyridis TaxID=115357 RepID=UPI001E276D5D|nr:ribonuclease P protein subunit p40-like isoform X2 [Harmonia axyridis]